MKRTLLLGVIISVLVSASAKVYAHCDTLDGPVIMDAKAALEKGDVTGVLKWVKKDDEEKIRSEFNAALADRRKGKDAQDADMKFFEALVRVHRTAEGAPFTGLKPAGAIEPVVKMADQALEAGSVDGLTSAMSAHLTHGISARFNKVLEKKQHMNESVEAGREYVEAYIDYMHYAEGVHDALMKAGAEHHHEEKIDEGKHHEEHAE